MLARTISTLILWTATLFIIVYFKSFGWALIITSLSSAALWETFEVQKKMGLLPLVKFGQIASVAICFFAWLDIFYNITNGAFGGCLIFALVVAIAAASIIKSPYSVYFAKSVLPTLAALCAIPFMLQWYIGIGATNFSGVESSYTGIILAIWILAAAKFSDVGAYVIGSAFGRHKMSPSISPQKTWEGAVGGIASSAAISAAIACAFTHILPPTFTPITACIAGAFIGCVAIISDLLESVFKRSAGVKDSGAVIPGIGGALDLADSMLLSAPIGAALLIFILKL